MARDLRQLTQRQLADSVGVSVQQIRKYESGDSRISANRLHQIAKVLTQPLSFFFPSVPGRGRDEVNRRPDQLLDLVTFARTPEGADLNATFSRINNTRVRRQVLQLVRSIAEDCGGRSGRRP